MQLLSVLPDVIPVLVRFADEVPEADDVTAGWVAFGIFLGLIAAVALLGWSLTRTSARRRPPRTPVSSTRRTRSPPRALPVDEA